MLVVVLVFAFVVLADVVGDPRRRLRLRPLLLRSRRSR
jgi:hypothetical protein